MRFYGFPFIRGVALDSPFGLLRKGWPKVQFKQQKKVILGE
jgi:hypothetical protein